MLTLDQLLKKNESKLAGLNPIVKEKTIQLIKNAFNRNVQILITQGFRSIEYQNELYAQGRTDKSKSIVTNAKGGYSYHNYGLAIDFALLLADGRQVSWDTLADRDKDKVADWMEVVQEAEKIGFEWGGRWEFVDKPHFQIDFGLSIKQLLAGKKPPTALSKPKTQVIQTQVTQSVVYITVNANNKILAGKGYLYNNRSYVPVRELAEKIGWGITVSFGDGKVILNGKPLQSTQIINNTGFALASEVADVLKLDIQWFGDKKEVKIG